eukprot:GFUD01026146.1.p1 GENE.GFUD01026146.1~~GFUD01026146.1.p1  ORF type:complete len:520 (+),score=107.25 GFUD01026146.1:67-1626(+)
MIHDDCPTPSNFSLHGYTGWLWLDEFYDFSSNWAAIPHHLGLGFLAIMISLPLYCLRLWITGRRSPPPEDTVASPPSLLSLVRGRQDDWLKKNKGRAALSYINFQRMLLFMAMVSLVISIISLLTNITGLTNVPIYFHKTTIANLDEHSPLHWFNIVISFLLPWLVVFVVRQFMVDKDKRASPTREESSTLVIEGLDPVTFSDLTIAEYFRNHYPNFQLVKITRAQDTRYLRRQISRLEWNTACITQLLAWGDQQSDIYCCGRDRSLAAFGRRELELTRSIQQEQRRLRSKTDSLRIVFLTFDSNKEAQKVVMIEELDHFSYYNTIKQAPRPEDIAWENMRSPVISLFIRMFSSLIILLVSAIATSPLAFAKTMHGVIVGAVPLLENFPLASSVIPTSMLMLFNNVMPYLVKLSLVRFGPWSKTKLVSNYMVTLFFWLLLTTVIFPTMALSNIFEVIEHILGLPIINIFSDVSSSEEDEIRSQFSCLFVPEYGSFFVNYLVFGAFLKTQSQLHRVGDRM